MERVGVWGREERLLARLEGRLGRRFRFCPGTHPAEFVGLDPALLVIAPSATGLAGASVLQPRLALLPGGNITLARQIQAASAVSYGLGGQNTLTLSSLEGGRVSLALQRELVTVSGRTVERQELVLPYDPETDAPADYLGLVGTLLLRDEPLG